VSYNDAFKELVEVMDTLREKCPWDQKQTIHTLSNLTVEEVYELVEGISTQDWTNIKEELGDLMLHLLFYSKNSHRREAIYAGGDDSRSNRKA